MGKQVFSIQWHLNEDCNLRCKHCYQNSYLNQRQLSFNQITGFIDHFFEATKKWGQEPEFVLTGGEPFLRKDFFKIIERIRRKSRDANITILSNGTLIDKNTASKLSDCNVNAVQLSIESPDRQTNDSIRGEGSYDKVINAIKTLKAVGMELHFHLTLSKMNVAQIDDFIQFAKENEIDIVNIDRLIPLGSGQNIVSWLLEPKELLKAYKKIYELEKQLALENSKTKIRISRTLWCAFDEGKKTTRLPVGGACGVGRNTLTILSDGTILPCRRLPIRLGNITKDSLYKVWYASKVLWNLRNTKKFRLCGKCKFLDKCGGCRGLAFSYLGDYMQSDPQCFLVHDKLPEYKGIKNKMDESGAYLVE